MPEQIPDSLLPKASAKQEAFITHYIDKNYKKKKAQKQAMLQSSLGDLSIQPQYLFRDRRSGAIGIRDQRRL